MFEEHPSDNCWRASSDVWAPSCWARCCSPKPAITLATSEHHRPFVPSLVPNHPRTLRISPIKAELQDMSDLPQKKRRISSCFGCGSQIHDQYILRVAPDLEWHAACLRCADCQQFLDETCTCFVRDGKTYCKKDYVRLFGTKCDRCSLSFNKTDVVMRAKTKIYHLDCFKCNACQKLLMPGEEFALRDDGLFCKEDHEELSSSKSSNNENNNNNNSITINNNNNNNCNSNNNNSNSNTNTTTGNSNNNSSSGGGGGGNGNNSSSNSSTNNNGASNNNNSNNAAAIIGSNCNSVGGGGGGGGGGGNNNNTSNATSLHHHHHHHHHHHNHNEGSNSDSSESGSNKYSNRDASRSGGSGGGGGKVASDGKPTRVRTVLNEKQLHMLRTCYAANPRPDALMKEQLVERTGLSPRVIRVWFQNKRCKDKKRNIAMKQQMLQEKEGRKMGYGSMQGIPMVASSPVRHESPIGISPIEVQSYTAPWKALSDFALHQDLDRLDMSTPHFQQIVNQMHGYDLPRPPLGMSAHDVGHATGPTAPGADMIHPDSTDSLVTYMESDESLQHDPGSP